MKILFNPSCLKHFRKALKAFTFEVLQRSVKMKFKLIFSLCPGSVQEGLIELTSFKSFVKSSLIVNQQWKQMYLSIMGPQFVPSSGIKNLTLITFRGLALRNYNDTYMRQP